jgi:hypothetical protein
MNHIQQLTVQRDDAREQCGIALQLVVDLQVYLTSSKFHNDPTVQCADVLRRIAEIKSALL